MRSANSWIDVIHPAAHLGAEGELERQIRRVQIDALEYAADMNHVNHVPACMCDVCAFKKRILSIAQRLKAFAAQPNDES